MTAFDALLSFQLTLLLHATVLLGAVWALERLGALRHPGWAELAWRGALFGALFSAALSVAAPRLPAWKEAASTVHPAGTADVRAPDAARAFVAAAAAPTTPTDAAAGPGPLPESSANAVKARAVAGPIAIAPWAAVALLAAWLLGLVIAAVRLAGQWWRLRHWQRRLRAHPAPAAPENLQRIAEDLAVRLALPGAPGLVPVLRLASPLLLPDGRVLLPDWVATLGPAQQRALLAHELAHLQRRDPAWRLAQRLARLPLAIHPLAHHAVRRLESLAEDACDARAAELCGSGRPLAEGLAACLAHHAAGTIPSPALAVAMAEAPGPVVRRVTRLLENRPMPASISPALRRTALAGALLAALALPGLAITSAASPAWAGDLLGGLFSGTRHTQSNGKDHYLHRNGATGERIEMTLRGDVVFTEGEDDIASLSRDGEFELSIKRGGVERSLRVVAGANGLQRRYEVDGEAAPFDAGARAWLAQSLPALLRETAMQAEARGLRILARGGTDALLAEIALIQGDHARGKYLAVLFAHAALDEVQLAEAIESAESIGSDYELRHALAAGLGNPAMTPAAQARLLQAAAGIGSDYELASLLVQLAESGRLDGPLLDAWRQALASLGSDYETGRVLSALLARDQVAGARLALEHTAGIGSDYEARQVLQRAVAAVRADATVRALWFETLGGIGSDFEQRQALQALLEAGPVDAALALSVLDALAGLGSDHEALQVLTALAGVMPADPAVLERYRAASRRLGDHERGRAERALDRFGVAVVD